MIVKNVHLHCFFALALATTARADLISSNVGFLVDVTPTGRHLELTGAFTVPQFDPSLGMLDFLYFDTDIFGYLWWNTIYFTYLDVGYTDFDINTKTEFLGVTSVRHEGPVLGGGGPPCGLPEAPTPCKPTRSLISNGYSIKTNGVVGADGESSVSAHWRTTLSGTPVVDFSGLTGQGTVDLPISFSLDAQPWNDRGRMIGDMLGPQSMMFSLRWTYDYTPTPVVEALSVTTPEPGYLALLAVVLACVLLYRGRAVLGLVGAFLALMILGWCCRQKGLTACSSRSTTVR